MEICLTKIDKRAFKVMQSKGFKQVDRKILLDILSRDSLVIDEIDLFDAVCLYFLYISNSKLIVWGKANCGNPNNGDDLHQFLSDLLHLVRFSNMGQDQVQRVSKFKIS